MRKFQGWAALIIGVLLLFNVFDVASVFGLAIGMAAMVAATLTFFTRLKGRRFSINSVLVGAFGIALVLNREAALQSSMRMLAVLAIIIGASNMMQYRRRRIVEEHVRFGGGAATVIVGITLLIFPGLPFTLLRIVVAFLAIGYGFLRLNAKAVPFTSFTWNQTVQRSMGNQFIKQDDIIDVEAEETTTKK